MRLQEVATLEGHTDRVWQVSWSPDGNCLASCGGDRSIRIWSKGKDERWECRAELTDQHKRTIRSVAWSPNGLYLAATSFDATCSIWSRSSVTTTQDFECTATLEGHENEVKAVSWSMSGEYIATCSRDKTVWIWEGADECDYECASVINKHSQDVKSVKWNPVKEELASCGYDNTINMYKEDDDDWVCYSTLNGHTSTVWSMSFDAGGERLVSAGDDNVLRIWQCYQPGNQHGIQTTGNDPTWKNVCTVSGHHQRTIYDVDWCHKSDLIVTASGDNSIRIFQENKESICDDGPTFDLAMCHEQAHSQDVNSVSWNPADEHLLASCSDDFTVKLWTLVT